METNEAVTGLVKRSLWPAGFPTGATLEVSLIGVKVRQSAVVFGRGTGWQPKALPRKRWPEGRRRGRSPYALT
jgi:hypothetical protein